MAEQFALKTGQDKLSRSHYKTFIDSSFGGETAAWFKLGRDNDDLSTDLNPTVTTTRNVWDETESVLEGYEPSMSLDKYLARKNDAIYSHIKDIAFNRLTDDGSIKTTFMEVIIDKTEAPFDAWTEDCIVVPHSTGGGTDGVDIPFEIHLKGNRKSGTVTNTNGVPVFTEAANG